MLDINLKQQEAFEKLSKLKAGALFMRMGTGKTKVAIDLIKSKINEVDFVIWIAPASLIRDSSYNDEIKKWGNDILDKFRFFTIEGVASSGNKYLEMHKISQEHKVFCVVDESITIKNTIAKRTQRLLSMWNLFDFRLILNGTAITKGLIDLYSQIQFIHPGILRMNERQFANNFLMYSLDGTYRSWTRWSKPANEEALIEIIRPYIFDAELDIDADIEFYDRDFFLSEKERNKYEEFKDDYLRKKGEFLEFLPLAQKFQQFYTLNCIEKNNYIYSLVEEIKKARHKVIIYVKYLSEIELLQNLFENIAIYSGNNKNGISQFRGNKDILVATYGTGSMGHNLQFCHNIIYFSQTFNYKDKIQSLHRVYRIGQENNVEIFNLWVKTGLEDIIKKNISRKRNVLSNVNCLISKEDAKKL